MLELQFHPQTQVQMLVWLCSINHDEILQNPTSHAEEIVCRITCERKVVLAWAVLWTPAPTLPELQSPRGSVHGGTVGVQVLPPLSASRVVWRRPRTHCGRGECKVLQKEKGYIFLPSSPRAQELVGSEVFPIRLSVPVCVGGGGGRRKHNSKQSNRSRGKNEFAFCFLAALNPVNKRGFQIQQRNLITLIELCVCSA